MNIKHLNIFQPTQKKPVWCKQGTRICVQGLLALPLLVEVFCGRFSFPVLFPLGLFPVTVDLVVTFGSTLLVPDNVVFSG